MPPEIGHEDLYGLFWNPAHLIAALRGDPRVRAGAPGRAPIRSPRSSAGYCHDLVPGLELVDASPNLARARAHKTADEIAAIEVAVAVAEAGLSALEAALRPGITERELLGTYLEAVASLGAPTPPSESVAFATPRQGPVRFRYLASDRPIGEGELVVLAPGALYAGYEGGVARTRTAGCAPSRQARGAGRPVPPRPGHAVGRLPGRQHRRRSLPGLGVDRRAAARGRLGHRRRPRHRVAAGGLRTGGRRRLEEGAVLSVQAWVSEEGTGGFLLREVVRIGEDVPQILTRSERREPTRSEQNERSERWTP